MTYNSLPASDAPNFAFSASHSTFASFMCIYTSYRRSARMLKMHPRKNSSGFRELFLIIIRQFAFRLAITDPENIHSRQPERGLNLPPLKVHSGELLRLQCIGKSSH